MAPPIDPTLIGSQTHKVRPKPAGDPRGQRDSAPSRHDGAAPGRRSQPAVSVSLSADALALLSSGRDAPHQSPKTQTRQQSQTAQTSTVTPTFTTDEIAEDTSATAPRQREAPFAHVSETRTGRLAAPGSRLDITV